ncbi:hypothetical protein F2Q69_00035272 [Brassica cretica]|uniref:DUF1985 domain-containing protein n=1 Tax=Brassica cretica TaxID=69181 RepID=A0A8S9SKS1_BRACR|nr:hypothetical protein F2Q69_00035272 [Brassica cretica]
MAGNVRWVRYAQSLRSDRAPARARSLPSDRVEWAFSRYVVTELWLELGFRKEESISKKYLLKKFSTFFFFGDLDVNFVVTVFDPNSTQQWREGRRAKETLLQSSTNRHEVHLPGGKRQKGPQNPGDWSRPRSAARDHNKKEESSSRGTHPNSEIEPTGYITKVKHGLTTGVPRKLMS